MNIRRESRKKFAQRGLPLMRQLLQMGISDQTENVEAQYWIAEQDRKKRWKESWRYWWMLLFTVVAAVGASIAAWPIVKGWMGTLER